MQPARFRKLTGFVSVSAAASVLLVASPALSAPLVTAAISGAAPYAMMLGTAGFGLVAALLALKWRREAEAARRDSGERLGAMRAALDEFESLLAEPYIRGRELTASVLGDRALLVTELVPKSGFYDFDAKYTDGMTEHVCPAQIPPEIEKLCLEYALKAHRLLGCRGTSRSDFRWDDERGEDGLFLLETNTQPGMTPLSLVPEQARHCGIDYPELVEIIVEDALRHFGKLPVEGAAG